MFHETTLHQECRSISHLNMHLSILSCPPKKHNNFSPVRILLPTCSTKRPESQGGHSLVKCSVPSTSSVQMRKAQDVVNLGFCQDHHWVNKPRLSLVLLVATFVTPSVGADIYIYITFTYSKVYLAGVGILRVTPTSNG